MKSKFFKSFIALFTAVLLVFSFAVSASASPCSDVSSSHWGLNGINYVTDNKYMTCTDGRFYPDVTVTRCVFVTVLYAKAGRPSASNNNHFTDVTSDAYYARAVTWAYNNGIVSGTSSTTFSPNDVVTRQDAMLMFLKLSEVQGYDTAARASISNYSDVSNVSSYALAAVQWGVSHGLIASTSSTSLTISPKAGMTRAQLAVILTNYGTNVEKLNFSRDTYQFTNASSNYSEDKYYILSAHRTKLYGLVMDYCTERYGATAAKNYWNSINSYLSQSGGHCFGMSLTAALDKMGMINMNGNFAPANQSTISLLAGGPGSVVESAITYYHVIQLIPDMNGTESSTLSAAISKAMNQIGSCKGLSLVSCWWNDDKNNEVGHTVLAYAVKKSGTTYTIYAYNPNYTVPKTITITSSGRLDNQHQLNDIKVVTDFSIYKGLDIDNYNNKYTATNTYSQSSTMNSTAEPLENHTEIEIALGESLCITNSAGQDLQWTNGELSGNMPVYSSRRIANGEDFPSHIILEVPYSDTFTYVSQSETSSSMYFSVMDSQGFACTCGDNISNVIVTEERLVEISGNEMEYTVFYSRPGLENPLISVQGNHESKLSLEETADQNAVSVTSQTSAFDVEVLDVDSEEQETVHMDRHAIISASESETIVVAETEVVLDAQ